MPLLAMAMPIKPGKTGEWHRLVDELQGPRREDFATCCRNLGVRERTFLQSNEHGEFLLVTLEGDDPASAFERLVSATDSFSTWFLDQVGDINGRHHWQPTASLPRLLIDSEPE